MMQPPGHAYPLQTHLASNGLSLANHRPMSNTIQDPNLPNQLLQPDEQQHQIAPVQHATCLNRDE